MSLRTFRAIAPAANLEAVDGVAVFKRRGPKGDSLRVGMMVGKQEVAFAPLQQEAKGQYHRKNRQPYKQKKTENGLRWMSGAIATNQLEA